MFRKLRVSMQLCVNQNKILRQLNLLLCAGTRAWEDCRPVVTLIFDEIQNLLKIANLAEENTEVENLINCFQYSSSLKSPAADALGKTRTIKKFCTKIVHCLLGLLYTFNIAHYSITTKYQFNGCHDDVRVCDSRKPEVRRVDSRKLKQADVGPLTLVRLGPLTLVRLI
jgi:hypothetical protein